MESHVAGPFNSPIATATPSAGDNAEQEREGSVWVRETRSQAIKLALAGYNQLKASRSGVLFLKGGLAISQITCLLVLLILAHHRPSPTVPGVKQSRVPSESCGKPLDKWILASIVRLAVCWSVSIWVVHRKKADEQEEHQDGSHTEIGPDATRPRVQEEGRRSSSMTVVPMLYKDVNMADDRVEQAQAERKGSYPDKQETAGTRKQDEAEDRRAEEERAEEARAEEARASVWTKMARSMDWAAPKISMSLGLLSLALFVYGNVLLFTSLDTCRRSAPLLWWGVMAVVGVGWFLLLEIVMVVLVVGIVGPGILVLLRRFGFVPPLPEPALPFPLPPKPMDATLVDELSKVVYLPAIPGQADEQLAVVGRVDMPEQEEPKGWAILQKKAEGGSATRATTYRVRPARMEGYVLPVVRLPQQMASCSICLNDFVEGRKITDGDVGADGLENALRFLDCGHVFHVECIDQWLTSASGRCPVCNVPVIAPSTTEQASKSPRVAKR